MRRKGKASKVDPYALKELPPTPVVLDKPGLIVRLNQKLVDAGSGNYLVQIESLSELRRTWISYEYNLDAYITITDRHNLKRKYGVIVPGMGPRNIELNKRTKMHTGNFFDQWDFEEQLWNKVLRLQKTINDEGYYAKNKDTGLTEIRSE